MPHHVVHSIIVLINILPIAVHGVLPVELHRTTTTRTQQRLVLVMPSGYHINSAHHHRTRIFDNGGGAVRYRIACGMLLMHI